MLTQKKPFLIKRIMAVYIKLLCYLYVKERIKENYENN